MGKNENFKPVKYDSEDIGCFFDNCRGFYIGCEIINLAVSNGFNPDTEDSEYDTWDQYEFYHELTDEAINYLNNNCRESDEIYWGFSESGDFGLWKIKGDE